MKRRASALWITALWTAASATATTTVPIDMSSGRPVVEINVQEGEALRMVLDTGAGGSVVDAEVARRLGLEVIGEGRTVSTTFEISAAPLAGAVTVAGHSIENPTISFDKLHRGNQANIGSGLLRRFVVTLDQQSKLVRFEQPAHGKPPGVATAHHPNP